MSKNEGEHGAIILVEETGRILTPNALEAIERIFMVKRVPEPIQHGPSEFGSRPPSLRDRKVVSRHGEPCLDL